LPTVRPTDGVLRYLLGLAQSTVSKHLACLRDCRLVEFCILIINQRHAVACFGSTSGTTTTTAHIAVWARPLPYDPFPSTL
jgi:hypothetical protein